MEQQKKPEISYNKIDYIFAPVFFIVAWFFWELNLFHHYWFEKKGIVVFTVLYIGTILVYCYFANIKPQKESWLWFAVLWGLAGAYLLPYGGELLGVVHYLMLMFVAQYWTLCVTGRLLKEGKTSNWVLLDILNITLILPFGNFMRLPLAFFKSIKHLLAKQKIKGKNKFTKQFIGVLCGGCLAGFCLLFILPSLFSADAAFAQLFDRISDFFFHFFRYYDGFEEFIVKLIFTIPTALYLYGFVFGCIRGRRTNIYNKAEICNIQQGLRLAPKTMVVTCLGILGLVYILFIGLQFRHFFGVFQLFGAPPNPASFSYAEYAREGFFELCRVACINIAILLMMNIISKQQIEHNKLLRICNIAISILTLLLLGTAVCKMALYIVQYGLTVYRVLVSVFLVWIAIVFALIIIRQFKKLNIVFIAVFAGAILFCALCVLPVEISINSYNNYRIEVGTLHP